MNIHSLQRGMVFKKNDKPNTFRIVDYVEGNHVYTRKPNKTPERISYQVLRNNYTLYTLYNCFGKEVLE